MSTLEYLTSLTTKGVKLSQTNGNQKLLKWQDVAAALGMGELSQEAYLLGRAKFCHDIPASFELEKLMAQKSSKLIRERKWKSKQDLSKGLAQVACLEAMSNHICPACCGTGILLNEPCEHCNGTGRERIPDANKYNLINMDKRNWQRRWRPRYEEIYQLLVSAEDELAHHLANQFQQ